MKAIKLLALALLCMTGGHVAAQDLIVKKDGSVIKAKVMKIGTSEVEYKKWSNQDGPQYSISVADILAINYQNGEKETFENVSSNGNNQTTNAKTDGKQNIIQLKSDDLSPEAKDTNDALIAKINGPVELIFDEKDKENIGKKEANSAVACFGTSSKSVLCDDNIEILVETGELTKISKKAAITWHKGGLYSTNLNTGGRTKGILNPAIQFVIKNKSNHTIYLDLANTFLVNMGQSQSFYIPSSTTTSKTSAGGASVNLGSVTGALGVGGAAGTLANGVNVGGGSASTTTNTTYSQRIIALAPMSSTSLEPKYFFGEASRKITTGLNYTLWANYTYLWGAYANFSPKSPEGIMMLGDHYTYNEDKSPIQFSFYLSYSEVETCDNTKTLPSSFYLKDLIGRIGGNDKPTNDAIPCFGFFVTKFNGESFPKQ
ncbi:MAG: hypothetical protein ACI4TR_00475 [Bacteroidaceae bacterium]